MFSCHGIHDYCIVTPSVSHIVILHPSVGHIVILHPTVNHIVILHPSVSHIVIYRYDMIQAREVRVYSKLSPILQFLVYCTIVH